MPHPIPSLSPPEAVAAISNPFTGQEAADYRGLYGTPVSIDAQEHLCNIKGLVIALEVVGNASACGDTGYPDAIDVLGRLALDEVNVLHALLWPKAEEART
jgi:hypothetical protein